MTAAQKIHPDADPSCPKCEGRGDLIMEIPVEQLPPGARPPSGGAYPPGSVTCSCVKARQQQRQNLFRGRMVDYVNESTTSWARYFRTRAYVRTFFDSEHAEVRYLTDAKAVRQANRLLSNLLLAEIVNRPSNRDIRKRIQQVTDLLLDDPAKWPTVIPLAARKVLMLLDLFGTPEPVPAVEVAGNAPQWEVAMLVALISLRDIPLMPPDAVPAPSGAVPG